jgi:DUF971 family protein
MLGHVLDRKERYLLSPGRSMSTRSKAPTPGDEEARPLVIERLRAVTPTAETFRESSVEGVVSRTDRFLSSRTVSAMTGDASKRKIRDWVDRGEFNSYALDGKTVYSEREVVDFLERVKARGPSRAPWRGSQNAASSARPGNALNSKLRAAPLP